jgi:hypothetical protein
MENKEIRILLTEALFSQSVKTGFITYLTNESRIEFPLTSFELREMISGKVLMKKMDSQIIQVAMAEMKAEHIKEILRRSPLYSSMAEEII